jgi:hypothetical protein
LLIPSSHYTIAHISKPKNTKKAKEKKASNLKSKKKEKEMELKKRRKTLC